MYLRLLRHWADLLRMQHMPPKKARAEQVRRLRRLVEFARVHSPFYRELYASAGVSDLTIRTMDDVCRLPFTNKKMMLDYGIERVLTVPVNTPRLKCDYTSGSTSAPFPVYEDRMLDFTSHVRVFVGLWKYGYRPAQSIVIVWYYPSNQVLDVERRSPLGRLQKSFGLFRRIIIPVQEDLDAIISKLRSASPDVLFSTCSMLELISRRLLQRGESLHVPLVMSTSETMLPGHRELFKQVYQGKVTTLYGCRECPTMAIGDIAANLDVMTNTVLFELTDEKTVEGGRLGEVVISNLINYDMPFIRYRLGDIANAPEGNEAILSRAIGPVQGRINDVLLLPSGYQFAYHHARAVAQEIFELVKQYKFVQTSDGRIILRIVPLADADHAIIRERVITKWRSMLPGEPPEIEFVTELPLTQGGKFKALEQL